MAGGKALVAFCVVALALAGSSPPALAQTTTTGFPAGSGGGSPTLTVAPCQPANVAPLSIHVAGSGFPPNLLGVQVRLGGVNQPVQIGGAGTFNVMVTVSIGLLPGIHQVQLVVQLTPSSPIVLLATTQFSVPCTPTDSSSSTTTTTTTSMPPLPSAGPTLVCIPPLGPPGFVTAGVGTGFPANTDLILYWSPGLGETKVTSDGSGNFTVPVLIFHRDKLGPRLLVAVPAVPPNVAPGAAAQSPPTAPFLVVPGTIDPPNVADNRAFRR